MAAANMKGRSRQRKYSRRTSGSVSIYFIAVTAAFVLLTGLLIDLARIAAFRKQSELSVKAGARSILSSYDPALYSRYGLFARGGDPGEEVFLRTLEGNREPEEEDVFRLLDTRWERTDVTESRPLGLHDVFRRQVLEEMKYKAPIDLTLEIASRFRGFSSVMKEAKGTVDALERMKQAYDRREEALDKAMSAQGAAGSGIVSAWNGKIPLPPVNLAGSRPAGRVQDIADAALMYDDYVAKRSEDAAREEARRQWERDEEERRRARESGGNAQAGQNETPPVRPDFSPRYSAEIAAYESGVTALAAHLSSASARASGDAERYLSLAQAALADAEDANAEMRRIASEAAAMATPVDEEAVVGGDQADALGEMRRTTAALALEESFFTDYGRELEAQRASAAQATGSADSFSRLLSAVPGSTGMGGALRNGAEDLQTKNAAYARSYGEGGIVVKQRAQTVKAHRASDEERKAYESQSRSAWSGVRSFLGTFSGLNGSPEAQAAFDKLDRAFRANGDWNQAEAEAIASAGVQAKPEEGRGQAMTDADGWLDALAASAVGGRDTVYFAEYTIGRFTRAEPAAVKAMLDGGDGTELMMPRGQQVEYVLYGMNNPSRNIAAAYGELFSFRLAIRTMEGLIECRSYGHPLVILAAATLYGIREAMSDMQLLLNKGTIPLSKYTKIDTYYVDYLRLFLLLHGSSAGQTSRRIAVIELETGISLKGAYTYVKGEGANSLRLWFLPGLIRLLGQAGEWGGTVKGGRYEATYAAEDAYQ
ncbi:hypothetical protein [Cohnella nanjingensis]|uniref:Uncharacterized protein n=1 Tax=Cohnella nanjingensis TaxID=1387779 RepID=A0A7X0VIQ2_9BACL|nr:hypothetical protein [Cohnella nanjingensis]MBB6674783.1 hypothetical protein [Cohnella nanjingensis]